MAAARRLAKDLPPMSDTPERESQLGPRLIVGRLPVPVPVRLATFYGAAFLMIGLYGPYWPIWLSSRGLEAGEIGLLLALSTWSKVVGSPLFASLADRLGARRRVMLGLACAALAAFAFYASAGPFWALCLGAMLTGFVFPPLLPMIENVTLLAAQISRFDYGRVRLWGSITFIAAASGGGAWLAGRSEAWIPVLMLGAGVLIVLAATGLPDVRLPPVARGHGSYRRLLQSRPFLLFLAAASLVQCSHAAFYGFATLHWRAAGLGEGTIGLLWAEGVVVEIVLFAFAGAVVRRVGIVPLLGLGAAAGVLRWLVTGLTTELWALALVQLLHAATFGCTHLAAMAFLQRAVPDTVSAGAQALYSAIAMGAVLALTMMAAGALYAAVAGQVFLAMAAMTVLGGGFAALLARAWDGAELAVTKPPSA